MHASWKDVEENLLGAKSMQGTCILREIVTSCQHYLASFQEHIGNYFIQQADQLEHLVIWEVLLCKFSLQIDIDSQLAKQCVDSASCRHLFVQGCSLMQAPK